MALGPAKGGAVTEIVDHQWAQSIYFKDPNGISLEYCCIVGERPQGSAIAEGGFTIRRAALDLGDALAADIAKAKPAHRHQR
jgi:hypothetical protein